MIPTKDLVKSCIDEVRPLVEQESQLKIPEKDLPIKLKKMILQDVSLCAIVRDEKLNPAGGIERFVISHVPFVEEAIIVDTGSLDGTREILEGLQQKYKNLKVFDHKFEGFADARNYSLSKAKTKYTLVLDADELITYQHPNNDWEKIKDILELKKERYLFEMRWILPDGQEYFRGDAHNGRLALRSKANYAKLLHERLNEKDFELPSFESKIFIRHFISQLETLKEKNENWYKQPNLMFSLTDEDSFKEEIISKCIAPSQVKGFSNWKAYNPQRDLYE